MTMDKAAMARARETDAALSAATEKLATLKSHLQKLETTREEAIIAQQRIEAAASGLAQITLNLQEDLDQLRSMLELLRKSGSQSGYVADRLGQLEEEFSEVVNDEINEFIRRAGSDLTDQSERRLRDALEGAMTAPLKSALAGLTAHRRKVVLEAIIETMATEATMGEAIDESATDDADDNE